MKKIFNNIEVSDAEYNSYLEVRNLQRQMLLVRIQISLTVLIHPMLVYL